jgi:hypothetical protein
MAQDGPVSGAYAHVTFDGTDVGGVNEWRIEPKADKKDITAFGSGSSAVAWRKYLATIKDATVTLTLAYLDLTDSGQNKLWSNLGGEAKTLKLYFDATNYVQVDAWVESFPIGSKVDDVEGAGTTVTLQIASAITT